VSDERYELLRSLIRDVPDFPKAGILFRDLAPLIADSSGFRIAIQMLQERLPNDIDTIVGVESRGFIFGAALAARTGHGFVPVRKLGKLPGATERIDYALEYGSATLEIQRGALDLGARVVVVDDLLATGGTAKAACDLVRVVGGVVATCLFVVELTDLGGRAKVAPDSVETLLAM
jgi:adenine phosphoribosyltransferase